MKQILTLLAIVLGSVSLCGQYTINNIFGDLSTCDTMTRGIYIAWWDKDFDRHVQVSVLLDTMMSYRAKCLDDLHMSDPPNPLDGYYYNVYIHVPGNDQDHFYPYSWGNGQGTDQNGYPFLTLPSGALNDLTNTAHETFHIFQYNATSPGFSYSGDSQWYIEGSANWFAARENPLAPRAFIEAESLVRVPQVPFWLSYDNFPQDYPSNWQRYVHQYASALFLFYLTEAAGLPEESITAGLYSGTDELPQEYLFHYFGEDENGALMRRYFIDWAAHMLNDFDFIYPEQAAANAQEWLDYADPDDDYKFIQTYPEAGSSGWYRPEADAVTCAWAFNTYRLQNPAPIAYTFDLNGDATGSYGDPSFFQGHVLVRSETGDTRYYDLQMDDAVHGSATLEFEPGDTAAYFIIASMPDRFSDPNPSFQTFSYEMQITPMVSAVIDAEGLPVRTLVARYNLLGQRVNKNTAGVQILVYDDGSAEKVCVGWD